MLEIEKRFKCSRTPLITPAFKASFNRVAQLLRSCALVLPLLCLIACNPYRYTGPTPGPIDNKLYVTNAGGGTISIIDLDTRRKYRDIWVGSAPHGLGISPDHQRLYVTVESSHLLREIETRSDEITRSVRLTGRPHQLAVTSDGRWIYVSLVDAGRVDIVEQKSFRVVDTLRVGRLAHNTFVPPGQNRSVYATSIRDQLVRRIDPARKAVTQTIYLNGKVRPIVVDSGEDRLFAALQGLHGFALVDIRTGREIGRFSHPLPPEQEQWKGAYLPTHGLALSPDEHELWVTSFSGRRLLVFSLADEPTLVDTVEVGWGPSWLAFHPDGSYLYASNAGSNTISIVDVQQRKEIHQIEVGNSPKRLLVAQIKRTEIAGN